MWYKIANGKDYNYDEVNENIGYATHFFKTFNREVVKKRNNEFMYMLADQVNDMIEDINLNAEELRKLYKENTLILPNKC